MLTSFKHFFDDSTLTHDMLTQNIPMEYDPAEGWKIVPGTTTSPKIWREWHGPVAWLFNPWTGQRRNAYDVGSDPFGHLIVPTKRK